MEVDSLSVRLMLFVKEELKKEFDVFLSCFRIEWGRGE